MLALSDEPKSIYPRYARHTRDSSRSFRTLIKLHEFDARSLPAPAKPFSQDSITPDAFSNVESSTHTDHSTSASGKSQKASSKVHSHQGNTSSTTKVHKTSDISNKKHASSHVNKPSSIPAHKPASTHVHKPASTPAKKHQSTAAKQHADAANSQPIKSTPADIVAHKSVSSHSAAPSHLNNHANSTPLPTALKLDSNAEVPSPIAPTPPPDDGLSSAVGKTMEPSANTPSPTSLPQVASVGNPVVSSPAVVSSPVGVAAQSPSTIPFISANGPTSAAISQPLTSGLPSAISSIASVSAAPNMNPNNTKSHRLGQVLVGVFGSLALLAAALAAAIVISRRRRKKRKPTTTASPPSDCPTGTLFENEKPSSLPRLSLSPSRGLDFGVVPDMSPSDPVTRYSQGGVTLLKRLQSLTANLDDSPSKASFSSDSDSSMAPTPVAERFEPGSRYSGFTKLPVDIISPIPGLAETVLNSADVQSPISSVLPPLGEYANVLTFWEDPRRSLLRSNSDDGSMNGGFRDETTSEPHEYRPTLGSPETQQGSPFSHHHSGNTLVAGSLTPPNKYDFQVQQGDPHFIIEALE